MTDSEQAEDGTVTIRLFKQRWTLSDDGEMVLGKGAPLDVPLNSWIDVRLSMPATPPARQPRECGIKPQPCGLFCAWSSE
ncbi:phage tail fiber protein [Pseudomonas aeruginosa]